MPHDNSREDRLLNPFDIVVPKGWQVISHGTSFLKWNSPMPGHSSQDLRASDRIVIHNTVDGGLACVGEDNNNLPVVYAGREEPVLFRIFVPAYGPTFDVKTIEEGLRFLKPSPTVPEGTTLVKLAENIAEQTDSISVLWYVPEQFLGLLERDLKRQQHWRESLSVEEDELDLGYGTFAAADSEQEEEHLFEQEEKADEYFEELEEQQQALIDEEIEAAERKEAKRAKDKVNARAQDKKNFERAAFEHEQQIAAANELRAQSENASNEFSPSDNSTAPQYSEPYSYSEPPSEDVIVDKGYGSEESYVYSEQETVPPISSEHTEVPAVSHPAAEMDSPSFNQSPANTSYDSVQKSESDYAAKEHVETPSPDSEPYAPSERGHDAVPAASGYDSDRQHFVSEPTPVAFENVPQSNPESVTDSEGINVSFSERRRQQQAVYDLEEADKLRKENNDRFQEELRTEARRRQEKVENYKSFGHSGIDFSGHEAHSAYDASEKRTVTEEVVRQHEQQFESTRAKFRSFADNVPTEVARAYEEASNKYFALRRQIDAGTVQVVKSTDTHSGAGVGLANQGSTPSSQSRGSKKSSTTVQNDATGDAATPRTAASLKNPPKSPIDNTPLYFKDERFKALKRLASDTSNGALRTTGLVKYQIMNTASAESTGTARSMVSTTRHLSNITTTMDLLIYGSGKSEAAKVWSKHVATEQNKKYHGVDKQAVKDFGKIDRKHLDCKLKEGLTDADLARLHKKFGKDADIGISAAVGTKNGKIGKRNVFDNGKVNVRLAEGKIGSMRNQTTNLKAEIRTLQAKGSQLTQAERQKLSDLFSKKKSVDEKLKKTVGATNSRHQSERLYRQINAMSPKKLDKELKRLDKKIQTGMKLNKVQTRQHKAMKERKAHLDMRDKLRGRGGRIKMLVGNIRRQVGSFLRQSEDETMITMVSLTGGVDYASRFATNRYVRKALKWSVKMQMLPVRMAALGIKKLDRKLGVSTAVKKEVSKVINAAGSKLLHTKPGEKIHSAYQRTSRLHAKVKDNGGLRKSVKKGIKTGISKVTPNKVKAAAKKVRDAFKRLNNNKVVRGAKSVIKAPVKGIKGLNNIFNAVKKVLVKYILAPVAIVICGAFIVSVVCSLLLNIPSAVFCGDESADGRIDLTSYIETLNSEQEKINKTVVGYKTDTETRGGKYKNVYVNYLGGANSNNYKEILSMAAVYFKQDFANDTAVNDYIVNLYHASNYVTTEESETYYCSGCEEREYHCYDKLDEYATDKRVSLYHSSDHSGEANVGEKASAQKGCVKSELYSCMEEGHGTYNSKGCSQHNDGKIMTSPGECDNYSKSTVREPHEPAKTVYVCQGHCSGKHYDYSCPGHKEKICKGHIDLYVNVVCLGFDKIFSADPGTTAGLDLGDYKQGDLIGTFNITYYCAEKYPHICNAGPPYKTASGTTVTAGRTIAVDKDVIPLGTPVIINGHLYVAEDTGGAINGNRIDIAVATHQEALALGTDVFKVYKAAEAGEEDASVQRDVIEYLKLAKEASSDEVLTQTMVLQAFGQAKDPEITWKYDRVNSDDVQSFTEKLQKFDEKHKNDEFTNAELNTFEYVKMSVKELRKLAKKRNDKDYDGESKYQIITDVLIPYDKEHPDVYVDTSSDDEEKEEFYFEGWNKENKEWAKNIHTNMKSELYVGLDEIGTGSAGESVSLEGVVIEGSKLQVKYYSQHDPRWANQPVRSDYPKYTISSSGCGPTSMAIVVSSLTSNTIDPSAMATKYGKTYYQPGVGAYWSIVPGISEDYGLTCTELGYSNVQGVINALKEGKLVVALVGSGGSGYTGSGYYKGAGHFLVICGVTKDGKFLLADCNNASVSTSGTGVDMQHFLNSGIKSWWTIGK